MDELHIEQAEQFVAQEREKKLQEIQNAVKPEIHPDFDGQHCVECGEDIFKDLPEGSPRIAKYHYICEKCEGMTCTHCGHEFMPKARVQMGRIKCVHCQAELELRNKQYNGQS